jgi:sialidase-1
MRYLLLAILLLPACNETGSSLEGSGTGDATGLGSGSGEGSAIAPPEPVRTVLFEGGEDGYRVYRIPSLLELPGGGLLAFAEGRQSLQDDGNIDLVMRRSDDGGATWSPLSVVIDLGDDTAGNPSPFVDPLDGRIWLPFCTNPGAAMNERHVWLTSSTDGGTTWAPPREITEQVKAMDWSWFATGPGRSIVTRTGRFVVPANHVEADGRSFAGVIYSDDRGATWQRGANSLAGSDESQVAELSDGRLMMSARMSGEVFARAFSYSDDAGETWSRSELRSDLPDPQCQGSLLMTAEGLLLANPATTQPLPRNQLTLRRSLDDGATFAQSKLIEGGPSAYSALATLPDGTIAMAWESGGFLPYDRIRFARISSRWLAAP